MIRRKFLRMIGLAPAAAIVAPAAAATLSVNGGPLKKVHMMKYAVAGNYETYPGYDPLSSSFEDVISATLRNRSASIIDALSSNNALLEHLKAGGQIDHSPLPYWGS